MKKSFNKFRNVKRRNAKKKNFTNEEVNILLEKTPQEFKDFLKVAAFTGMRLQEILSILEIEIDKEAQIKYIQVGATKTTNGTRKIPLHREIEDIQFPLFEIAKTLEHLAQTLEKE